MTVRIGCIGLAEKVWVDAVKNAMLRGSSDRVGEKKVHPAKKELTAATNCLLNDGLRPGGGIVIMG